MLRKIISFTFFLGIIFSVKGQELPEGFVRISSVEGMISDNISRLFRDSYGFIWLGTPNGLIRYDGREYRLFIPNDKDPASISGSDIRYIYEDKHRCIWIGNFRGGVNMYNPRTEKFKQIKPWHGPKGVNDGFITSITEDKAGRMWFGTFRAGIDIYFPEKDSVFHFQGVLAKNTGLLSDSIRALYTDSDGSIWVGTHQKGIYKISFDVPPIRLQDFITNVHIDRYLSKIQGKEGPEQVLNITPDRDGSLLISTNGMGVIRLDPHTGHCESWQGLTAKNGSQAVLNIRKVIPACSRPGYWIATMNDGIIFSDGTGKVFQNYRNDSYDPLSLSGNQINDMLCAENELWVAPHEAGLSLLKPSGLGFRSYRHNPYTEKSLSEDKITSITEDPNGNILAGTENGYLNVLNPATHEVKRIGGLQNVQGKPNKFLSMIVDRMGFLWAGGYGNGLFRIKFSDNWKNFDIAHFENIPNDSASLSNDFVTNILETRNGEIWITTVNGVNQIIDNAVHFRVIRYNPSDSLGLGSRAFLTMCEDSEGDIWFGSMSSGITILPFQERNSAHPRFRHLKNQPSDSNSLRDNVITNITQTSDGYIWISTARGLDRYEKKSGSFVHYTTEQGLPGEIIYWVQEDQKGNLWISTGTGLSKLESGTGKIRNFGLQDGLPGTNFNQSCFYKARSGYFYFGGNIGLSCFNPDRILKDNVPPPIVFTALKILDQPVAVGENINGKIILNESISTTKEITLSHRENILSFEWAVLDYAMPQRNLSAIRLEGYDEDWRNLGTLTHTTYTNLSPGHYVLHVKGANSDGVWNDQGITLGITILPPFWATTFFRILILVFIVGLVYSVHRYRVYFLTQKRRELLKEVRDRTQSLELVNQTLLQKNLKIDLQAEELRNINEELLRHKDQLEDLIRDRTAELVAAKNKAEESDKLKTSFLANMSHEIRTPMNAIVGFSGMLIDPEVTTAERNEYVQIIQTNSEYLLRLINDIIDLSMLNSGQLKLHYFPTDINQLLIELFLSYSGLSPTMGKQQLKFMLSLDNEKYHFENPEKIEMPSPVIMNTDPVRLRQVLINLLDNAFKYTEAGSIQFGYNWEEKEGKKFIALFVEDTGFGIPVELQQKIFDRFYKIEDPQVRKARGTGLGLAITRNLCERLGGSILVASAEGKGSRFTLYFPFEKEAHSTQKIISKDEHGKHIHELLSGKVILIAEDESSNFDLLKGYLRNSNCHILHAKNGHEALEFFKKTNPDVILMDLKMDVMDGNQTMKAIRNMGSRNIIIAQTAQVFASDIDELRNQGFDEVLLKPIKRDELFRALSVCFGNLK